MVDRYGVDAAKEWFIEDGADPTQVQTWIGHAVQNKR
jgi:hypothetical protein